MPFVIGLYRSSTYPEPPSRGVEESPNCKPLDKKGLGLGC